MGRGAEPSENPFPDDMTLADQVEPDAEPDETDDGQPTDVYALPWDDAIRCDEAGDSSF